MGNMEKLFRNFVGIRFTKLKELNLFKNNIEGI